MVRGPVARVHSFSSMSEEAIVIGAPQLRGSELRIPTRAGIARWNFRSPEAEATLTPWPAAGVGGTLIDLPDASLLSITRGFEQRYGGRSRARRPQVGARVEWFRPTNDRKSAEGDAED